MIRRARRILGGARHRAVEWYRDWKERMSSPFHEGDLASHGAPNPLFETVAFECLDDEDRRQVLAAASLHAEGFFDLLGSGWADGRVGGASAGFPDAPVFLEPVGESRDRQGAWLERNLPRRVALVSRERWSLLPEGHQPLDWCRDLRSGFRWDLSTRYNRIRYGDVPGADVKGPWELGRLQHLAVLSLAASLEPSRRDHWAGIVRAHWVDFVASNPPGQGVQWTCTMDVAIRAANLCFAYDLLRAAGWTPDSAFEDLAVRSVAEHVRWIGSHMEWHPWLRANHYLADVAGLLVATTWLPEGLSTESRRSAILEEFLSEVGRQFHPDGSNFEASTAYHRLSSEMLAWGSAIVVRRGATGESVDRLAAIVQGAASFLDAIEAPDGGSTLVGDCDSGRFLRAHPSWESGKATPSENPRDFRQTKEMLRALLEPESPMAHSRSIHSDLIQQCARACIPTPTDRRGHGMPPSREIVPMPFRRECEIPIPPGAEIDATAALFPGIGIATIRSRQIHLVFRCGELGQLGNGGHAHFDPLAIELWVDGHPRILDPGSFCYTPDPGRREAWRSSRAHWMPVLDGALEPGRTDGLFRIVADWRPEWLEVQSNRLSAQHQGWGTLVRRTIRIEAGRILVVDESMAALAPLPILGSDRPWTGEDTAFSPGYGILRPDFGT